MLAFLFHGIRIQEEDPPTCDPTQLVAQDAFRVFVEHFARHGYKFIAPSDLNAPLSTSAQYVMITFDDGYYNNTAALPVLEEFECPATFFVATGHIESGQAFWWDVVYRERFNEGATWSVIEREREDLKKFSFDIIDRKLVDEFGLSSLGARGDQDRPMTPDELRTFSAHPLVHLGNHTVDHAILTACSLHEVRDQIVGCQEALMRLVGSAPEIISYPNGYVTQAVAEIAREAGLRLGITTVPRRNRLTHDGGLRRPMLLNRHMVPESRIGEDLFMSARAPISLRQVISHSSLRGRR